MQNAITHSPDRSYIGSGSGIAALESYHAGAIRTLMLFNATQKVHPFNANYAAISTVRHAAATRQTLGLQTTRNSIHQDAGA